MEIIFVLKDGEKRVQANAGDSLLDVIQDNDIPVMGACGGAGVCGSCRVRLDANFADKVNAPSEHELDVLDMFQSDEDVRLACQVTLTDACEGLRVSLL